MVDSTNTTNSYLSLITQAIGDFDAIFNAMAAKGVKKGDVTLGTGNATISSGIRTSEYAGLIANQLFVIDGLLDDTGEHSIANYTLAKQTTGVPGTVTLKSKAVSGENVSYTAEVTALPAGYYDATSKVNISLPAEDITLDSAATIFSHTDPDGDEPGYYYYGGTTTLKVISSVTVVQGSVSNTYGENARTDTRTIGATVNFGTSKVGYVEEIDSADAEDYYAIPFTKTINVTAGKLTVTPTKVVSEGYVKTDDVTLSAYEENFTATNTALEGTQNIYIPKGSITNISSTPVETGEDEVGKIKTNAKLLDTTDLTAAQIAAQGIKVSTVAGAVNIKGTFGAGYVEGGEDISLGNIGLSADEVYLEKTAVAAQKIEDVNGIVLTTDAGTITGESAKGKYDLVLDADLVKTYALTEGYLDQANHSVTVDLTKTISIKKGEYTINPSASISLTEGSIASDSDNGGYAITLTPVIADPGKSADQFTEGYIKLADIKVGTKTQTAKTVYVAHGAATVSSGLTTDFVAGTDDDGYGTNIGDTDEGTGFTDIFTSTLTAAMQKRDYYEITASSSRTVTTEGYMKEADIVVGGASKKYLPKAVLEWVEGNAQNGNEDFLQVTTGGYLPAGTIKNISKVEMSAATIGLAVGTGSSKIGESAVFTTSVISDGYKLVVGKNASTTNAGYFSGTQGTFSGDFYIAKGSVGATTSVGTLTKTDVTPVYTEGEDGEDVKTGYTIGVSGKATTNITVGTGYTTQNDVTLNNAPYDSTNNQVDIATTVELNQAEIAYSANALTLGINHSTIETAESGTYYVSPTVEGTVTVATSIAGYTAQGDATSVSVDTTKVATANKAPVYIKTGEGAEITLTNSTVAATANFTDTVADGGSYTVSVGGNISVSGSIGTGYYGTAESTIAAHNKNFTGTGLSIPKAKVTSTVSATTKVGGTIIKFVDEVVDGTEYATVTSDINTLSNTLGSSTDGYVKATDIAASNATTNSAATATQTKRIDLVRTATTTVGTGEAAVTYYASTIGATSAVELSTAKDEQYQTVVLDTDDKYSRYDTKITLGSHAMGTAVVDEFAALKERLAGTLTRS